ncbi:MAG: hypothetical protein M9938_05145 [Solirubrobacterales bacterium]|nr:hypothetical protein [Solirubrobacterales bacterium]
MRLTFHVRVAVLITATAGLLLGIGLGPAAPSRADEVPNAQPTWTRPAASANRGSRSGPKPWSKLSIPRDHPSEVILPGVVFAEGIDQLSDGLENVRDLIPWG